jgi:hypothetical protein
MLLWMLSPALAQQQSEFVREGYGCLGAVPIAGTAGYSNLRTALRTAANTYSAVKFAENHTFTKVVDPEFDEPWHASVAYELHTTYNVARVPAFHPYAVYDQYNADTCEERFRVANRPADLNALSFGAGVRFGRIGAFYAASLSSGQMAREDAIVRSIYWSALFPIYGLVPLAFAPVMPLDYHTGSSAMTMDFLAGLYADLSLLEVRGGYTRSKGWYLYGQDRYLSLFGSLVLGGGPLTPGDVLRTGLEAFSPADLAKDESLEPVGQTGAYYRDLPFGASDAVGERNRLRSAHLRQANLGRHFDLAVAYRLQPEASVSEALLAVHTANWRESADSEEEAGGGVLLQGGAVELPDQYTLGVEGGWVPSFRFQAQIVAPEGSVKFQMLFNDAEQLALYPFARNALSYDLVFDAQF